MFILYIAVISFIVPFCFYIGKSWAKYLSAKFLKGY